MFDDLLPYNNPPTDKELLNSLANLIFELTGDVNMRMRLFRMAEDMEKVLAGRAEI